MERLKTIGLVGDHAADLAVLRDLLTGLGYTVQGTASNGPEAVVLAAREKPQVLLVDLHRPKIDGMVALQSIMTNQKSVILLLSGDGDLERAHEGLSLGATGYLPKPFTAQQLSAALESGWFQAQTVLALRAEFDVLKETLEVRKLADKAKGILMEQQGFSENEAHHCLQKMSQDQGIPLKEVCRSLIQVRMILGQTGSRKAAMKPQGGH